MDSAEWFRWAAAFFLGALSTVLIEFGRGQLERRQRRQDRRDDFQRETLVALQETLIQSAQQAAHIHDVRESGRPPNRELDESRRLASLEASMHGSRILDERTRELVNRFHQAVDRTNEAGGEYEALRRELISALEAVIDRIGELLRRL